MSKRRRRASSFEVEFREQFAPVLEPRGFSPVVLHSCISPEVLWRRGADWIGASFDERDRFLDLNVGHLHWFRDVMPRVVIRDRLREIAGRELAAALKENDVERAFGLLAGDFDQIWSRYLDLPEKPPGPGSAANDRYRKEYFSALGPAVTEEEILRLQEPS